MSRVYFDTNTYIYSFDRDPVFGKRAEVLLTAARLPQHQIFATPYVLGELLVRPVRTDDYFQQARIRLFFTSKLVTLLPYPLTAVEIFARLRAVHRVKPLDALHLACAANAGVDLFITNDLRLQSLTIAGIGRIASLEVNL